MPSNNTCWLVHYWQGLYGNLGHLYGPRRVESPTPHLPYVLDNGAFGAWKNGTPWDEDAFVKHVERYAFHMIRPEWVVVPDVVANAVQTFSRWRTWAPRLRDEYGLKLALAVQDAMTPADVSVLTPTPDVIFVGGSTEWKWATVADWCRFFPRVHVGRVNTASQLDICKAAGAESVDGTGWFRGDPEQILQLGRFLAKQSLRWDVREDQELQRIVALSRTKTAHQKRLPLEVA